MVCHRSSGFCGSADKSVVALLISVAVWASSIGGDATPNRRWLGNGMMSPATRISSTMISNAITIDQSVVPGKTCDTCAINNTYSWSHTVAGADRLLVVALTSRTIGVSHWSVSVDGSLITQARDADSANGSCAELWYQNNPTASIHTISIMSPVTARGHACSFSFNGVDTTGPIVTTTSNTGTATPATLVIPSSANNWVMDAVFARVSGATISAFANQTELYNLGLVGPPTTQRGTGGASYTVSSGGSPSMSWTLTGQDEWVQVAVDMKVKP